MAGSPTEAPPPDRSPRVLSGPVLAGPVLSGWLRRRSGAADRGEGQPIDRRHSQRVAALKVGLPLLALVLVTLMSVWPYLISVQKSGGKIDKNQTVMLNPRYFSHDRQDRPFSFSAKSATEVKDHTNLVDLVAPEAEMTQSNGAWLTVTSERGRYNQEDGRLLMLDNVHVLRDDGFEFVTDVAEVDTKSGNAWGDHPVTGQGPSGEIHADGFTAVDHGKTITFSHSSHATVAPGAASKSPAASKGSSK